MTSRTLFLAVAATVIAMPAFAQSVTTRSTPSQGATLSKSDEEFLTEMPDIKFPGKEEMMDRDGDGIVDSEQTGTRASRSGIPDPFAPDEQEKPKVIYKYNPPSSTSLRRVIQDDRIEDGYVQGYMQQTGPKENN